MVIVGFLVGFRIHTNVAAFLLGSPRAAVRLRAVVGVRDRRAPGMIPRPRRRRPSPVLAGVRVVGVHRGRVHARVAAGVRPEPAGLGHGRRVSARSAGRRPGRCCRRSSGAALVAIFAPIAVASTAGPLRRDSETPRHLHRSPNPVARLACRRGRPPTLDGRSETTLRSSESPHSGARADSSSPRTARSSRTSRARS